MNCYLFIQNRKDFWSGGNKVLPVTGLQSRGSTYSGKMILAGLITPRILPDMYPAWQINILFKFYLFYITNFYFFLDFDRKKNYTTLYKG